MPSDPPMLKKYQSGRHDFPGFSGILWLHFLLLAALLVSVPSARAAITYGLNSDTDIRDDGLVGAANGTNLLAGGTASPVADRAAVYVFQLPDFGAVANPFTTAKFQFHLSSKSGTPPNVDLYGLGRRASSDGSGQRLLR